jgi:hypothetical protein
MKMRLDMGKIARGLGAERRGKVVASGGYFGAIQLLADVEARFRVPPRWWTAHGCHLDRTASRPAGAANTQTARGACREDAGACRRERRAHAAYGASPR